MPYPYHPDPLTPPQRLLGHVAQLLAALAAISVILSWGGVMAFNMTHGRAAWGVSLGVLALYPALACLTGSFGESVIPARSHCPMMSRLRRTVRSDYHPPKEIIGFANSVPVCNPKTALRMYCPDKTRKMLNKHRTERPARGTILQCIGLFKNIVIHFVDDNP